MIKVFPHPDSSTQSANRAAKRKRKRNLNLTKKQKQIMHDSAAHKTIADKDFMKKIDSIIKKVVKQAFTPDISYFFLQEMNQWSRSL